MAREDMERRVAEVFEAGDREDLVRAYARWAERYDEDMLGLEMRGREIIAAMAARYLQDRASPILDAGAGTGRVGESFRGFGKSDGDTGSATIDQMVSDALAAGPIDGYVKLAPAATKEAVIIPGADHIYEVLTNDQTDADHVIAITAEWFAKTL